MADRDELERVRDALFAFKTSVGSAGAELVEAWDALDGDDRAATVESPAAAYPFGSSLDEQLGEIADWADRCIGAVEERLGAARSSGAGR